MLLARFGKRFVIMESAHICGALYIALSIKHASKKPITRKELVKRTVYLTERIRIFTMAALNSKTTYNNCLHLTLDDSRSVHTYIIRMHSIVFLLCLMKQKERRWTKLKFSCLVFSALLKVSGTYRVDLALE